MKITEKILSYWRELKSRTGSDHIATPITLQFLDDYCKQDSSVLELGGGIGAITEFLTDVLNVKRVDVYEDNDFCIGELKKIRRANVIETYLNPPPMPSYDLVIIDGGNGGGDGGFRRAAANILNRLENITFVYLEGIRTGQRLETIWTLSSRYAIRVKSIRGRVIDGTYYKGGTLYECRAGGAFKRVTLCAYNLFLVYTRLFLKRHGLLPKRRIVKR